MFIAKQNLVIFGKVFKENEEIRNNINGKIYTNDEIREKLEHKGFKYIEVDKNEKTVNITKNENSEISKEDDGNRKKRSR